MRGAALHFWGKLAARAAAGRHPLAAYDALIASGLMSLSDFKSLAGGASPPAMVYFHESQLTYPLAPGEAFDVQFGFTDITTALAADRVVFNSRTHFDRFFATLPGFLNRMPDCRPAWVAAAIRQKARVIHPGCRFSAHGGPGRARGGAPPLIVWNHRWEFDKNPEAFFDALDALAAAGVDFRLALLGERYRKIPPAFSRGRRVHAARILHDGYLADRDDYWRMLCRSDIVVSTALQENFGISVVEAVRAGCLPLLPRRLSYPELIPREFHRDFLYDGPGDLLEKLARLIAKAPRMFRERQALAGAMSRHAWEAAAAAYDELLAGMVAGRGSAWQEFEA